MLEPNEDILGAGVNAALENNNSGKKNDGAQPPVNNAQGEPATPPEKKFSQEDVNAIVAAEKRKSEEKIATLKKAGLSEEQIKALEDKEEIQKGREELATIRKEKVEAILDKHKSLVEKLDATQVEQLKSGTPEKVGEFLDNLSSMVAKATGEKPKEGGELGGMNDGVSPGLPNESRNFAEGVDEGIRTGNWGKAIDAVLGGITK